MRLGLVRAAAAAGALGVACGFLFALRVGAVVAPLAFAAFTIGVSTRWLVTAAGAAIAAIPIVYILNPAPNYNGFSFFYPVHYISAHWLGVTALICLAVACGVTAARRRAVELAAGRLARPCAPGSRSSR